MLKKFISFLTLSQEMFCQQNLFLFTKCFTFFQESFTAVTMITHESERANRRQTLGRKHAMRSSCCHCSSRIRLREQGTKWDQAQNPSVVKTVMTRRLQQTPSAQFWESLTVTCVWLGMLWENDKSWSALGPLADDLWWPDLSHKMKGDER